MDFIRPIILIVEATLVLICIDLAKLFDDYVHLIQPKLNRSQPTHQDLQALALLLIELARVIILEQVQEQLHLLDPHIHSTVFAFLLIAIIAQLTIQSRNYLQEPIISFEYLSLCFLQDPCLQFSSYLQGAFIFFDDC